MEGSAEAGVRLVVAGCYPAKLLEIAEEVLNQMPPAVHGEVAWDMGGAVRLGRNDGQRPPFIEFRPDPVDVESLVGQEGIEFDAGDEWFYADAVMPLAREQDEAGQVAQGIDKSDDLGRQPSA